MAYVLRCTTDRKLSSLFMLCAPVSLRKGPIRRTEFVLVAKSRPLPILSSWATVCVVWDDKGDRCVKIKPNIDVVPGSHERQRFLFQVQSLSSFCRLTPADLDDIEIKFGLLGFGADTRNSPMSSYWKSLGKLT
jgi:hypothetical protein